MKLSIVMPSHNVGPRVNANILNASLLGNDGIEVIIRDNSGNEGKQEFLSQIQEKNCRIISVDECPGSENYQALVAEAKADFVFFICDDDYVNGYAVPTLVEEIERVKDDLGVVGVSGIFVQDDAAKTSIFRFDNLNTRTAIERFEAYLKDSPSIFHYSPLRRGMMQEMWKFISKLPVFLSYHDWLINCIYLMHGRITYIDRYIYQYYNSNWATDELCLKTDAHYFRKAGLDTSAVRLQWLIAGFEGAQTFMSKYQGVQMPQNERQALAAYWFSHWYPSFINTSLSRQAPDAKFDAEAIKMAMKWRSTNEMRLDRLLTDIAEYFSLSSPEIAQRYYNFWR